MATIGTPDNLAERSDDERFYKFKGLSHLKPRAQAIVREVLAWRTDRARELDLPIRNILSDEAVRDIAIRTPTYLGALAEIKGVPRSVVGRFGHELIDLVDAVETPAEPFVRRGRRHPLDDLVKDTTQHVREYVRAVSEERGIDPIMVCTRTDVERWVRKGGKTSAPFLEGWRGTFIGDAVRAMIPSDLADLDL
jgi:ribonuclease D